MGAYVALCCFQPDKANPVLVLSIAFAVVAFLCVLLDSCKGCRIVLCCRKNLKELEGKIEQQESQIVQQESQIADAKKAVEAGYSPKPELTDQCPFCLELAKSKDNAEYYRRPNDTSVHEYTAALVSQTYYDGYPSGRVTSYNHPLNFCPVCGKILMEPTIDDKGSAT